MKKSIFQLIPILAIFIASIGYSYTKKNGSLVPSASDQNCRCEACEPCRECDICPPCEPCCTEVPKTGEPCNCAYNAPARIDPACGWDSWLSLSFIYWQAIEKGLELGRHQNFLSEELDYIFIQNNAINMDFDYHPGFKIGAGLSFERDDWELYLEYTWLRTKNRNTEDLGNEYDFSANSLFSSWFSTSSLPGASSFKLLKAKWTISYNMFDLELRRPFYLGKKLIFKPHFGLRGGWINQKYSIDGLGVFVETEETFSLLARNNQDSWMIGPRAGLDTHWLIGCNFRIFGNVAGSLTYQKFKAFINQKILPIDIEEEENTYIGKNENSYLTPNVELALGLGYGRYLCNSEWYFDISAGYDFHYFWNQNFMRHLKDKQNYYISSDTGNLMLHGLTITARLDF